MALLLTILIIGLMGVITSEFTQSRWHDRYAAANLSDGIRLNSIARSGLQLALAVIVEEGKQNEFDTLHEAWALLIELTDYSKGLFNNGYFEINVQDQSGRIQINRLIKQDGQFNEEQRALLTTLLSLDEFDLTPEEIDDIIDSIKDWIDRDDEVTQFGSENAYYQALERPYFCRNGSLETLDELLLINHITPKLYHGTEEIPGLKHFLTVYGQDGKININTADPVILKALSLVILGQDFSEDWVKYRENEDNDLSQYNHYQGLSDLTKEQSARAGILLTTSSGIFKVTSVGVFEEMKKGISSTIKRQNQGKGYQILSWEIL
jgi:general secretion pathway protein K